jgi:hypothetical protein
VRVSDTLVDPAVKMTFNNALFGKITGDADTEWVDPNSQAGGE